MLSEFEFIEGLKKGQNLRSEILLGIGDDCAALASLDPKQTLLFTTDLLTEGVHFDLSWCSAKSLGWKSVAVNLSDLAAMGGQPIALLWSLAIPKERMSLLEDLAQGVRQACQEFGVALIGGDTSSAKSDLTLSHTLIGKVAKDEMIKRSGAQPGDAIFCSGTIGLSGLGLKILQRSGDFSRLSEQEKKAATEHFLNPVPRLFLGNQLSALKQVSAMMDVSDGLLQDLQHILKSSRVSAFLDPQSIPLSKEFRASGLEVWQGCVSGEDYELLFTAPEGATEKILSFATSEVPITRIGEIRSAELGVGNVFGASHNSWPENGWGFKHF